MLQFKQLEYISSNGLRAIVAALKAARAHNGDVIIVEASNRIKDTLELVGFQSLFNQYDNLLDAVDAF